MQITATGSNYRCVWPGGTGKRCYCGDCFWGMCICQSLPNCIIHSIVCVLQHFLRNAQISRLSTCPHCCIPPSLLTAKTRAAVGQRLPFSEACQGRWGAWSLQSEVLRGAGCVNMRGRPRLWTCWSWRRQWSVTGHATVSPAYTSFWKSLVIMDRW